MEGKNFAVIDLPELKWPTNLIVPAQRFRLLVAVDCSELSTSVIADFASTALSAGAIYFCSWGPGCERLHDVVDEVLANDDAGLRRFAGANIEDVVMTTWHEDESLEDALEFFATSAVPTGGFSQGSSFRLVICAGNPSWAVAARQFLASAKFFI